MSISNYSRQLLSVPLLKTGSYLVRQSVTGYHKKYSVTETIVQFENGLMYYYIM